MFRRPSCSRASWHSAMSDRGAWSPVRLCYGCAPRLVLVFPQQPASAFRAQRRTTWPYKNHVAQAALEGWQPSSVEAAAREVYHVLLADHCIDRGGMDNFPRRFPVGVRSCFSRSGASAPALRLRTRHQMMLRSHADVDTTFRGNDILVVYRFGDC